MGDQVGNNEWRCMHNVHVLIWLQPSQIYSIYVWYFFSWLTNVTFFICLIRSPWKYLSPPIIGIWNSWVIISPNSSKKWCIDPRMILSIYTWHTNRSFPILLVKIIASTLHIFYLFEGRKSLDISYHALGAWFNLYSAFGLYIWLGLLQSSKSGGIFT